MSYVPSSFVAVYQVLDDVLIARVAPPGAKATIHSAIDELKSDLAPRELVAQLEEISVELHKLDWAAVRADAAAAAQSHEALRSIATSWLDHCAT